MRYRRTMLAVAASIAVIGTGCSVERGNYLQSPNGAVIVELPTSYRTIDDQAVLSLAVERVPAQDRLVLSHWVAGFSAVAGTDPGAIFSGETANVGGIVRSRHIVSPELDTDPLSVGSLLQQMNDLALLPNGTEIVVQRNQRGVVFGGMVNGIETEVEFATPNGRSVARYLVAVDVLRGQLHSLLVGCSAACFDANRATIDAIVASFTLVEQAAPRGR